MATSRSRSRVLRSCSTGFAVVCGVSSSTLDGVVMVATAIDWPMWPTLRSIAEARRPNPAFARRRGPTAIPRSCIPRSYTHKHNKHDKPDKHRNPRAPKQPATPTTAATTNHDQSNKPLTREGRSRVMPVIPARSVVVSYVRVVLGRVDSPCLSSQFSTWQTVPLYGHSDSPSDCLRLGRK